MFQLLKEYLNKMRNAEYVIIKDEENLFQVEIKTKLNDVITAEKWFTIHFRDGYTKDQLDLERPMHHYYYLQFVQENVPYRDRFTVVTEQKWYRTEEDIINRIKTLKSRYR